MTYESTTPSVPPPEKETSLLKMATVLAFLFGVMVVIAIASILIKRDDILNSYVKEKLIQGVARSQHGSVLKLSDLHYQIWQNCLICDSGSMSVNDAAMNVVYDLHLKGVRFSLWRSRLECTSVTYATSDNSSACTIDTVAVDGLAPLRLIEGEWSFTKLLAEVHIRLSGLALTVPPVNTVLKCAQMWVSPGDSQLSADRLTESDSFRVCSMEALSLHGIDWTKLISGKLLLSKVCATSVLDAKTIVILYPGSQYEFQCGRVHASFPASKLSADSVEIQPVNGDERFFADSKWRKTRIQFDSPRCSMERADLCGLIDGSIYSAGLVQIQDASIDILINKDKPFDKRSPPPRMPHQILAMEGARVWFDSVQLINGTLLYQERFDYGAEAAQLKIDRMNVTVKGFGNHLNPPDTATVTIQARLQGNNVNATLSVPLAGAGLSARYSGSMVRSDLSCFNSWIEIEDAMRVTSGQLQEASFDIDVKRGVSKGTLHAVYKNLSVAFINSKTKGTGGLFNVIKSFIANKLRLRTNNVPDKSGKLKIARVRYVHKSDEPFFQFLWFSLRTGLKDLVGF